MNKKTIWWVLGAVGVIALIFFAWRYVVGLQKDLQIEKQNLAYTENELEIVKSDLGNITSKYVYVLRQHDDIVQEYKDQGKDLAILQDVNLQLVAQLESDTVTVIVDTLGGAFSGVLTSVFQNEYSDSGLTVSLKDSVVFSQDLLTLRWISINFPEFFISMRYNMIIYRDEEGLLSGTLETFSPFLKASILETQIVDDYIPSLSLMSSPSIFAITVGGGYQYANIGLFLRLSRYAFNVSYNFISGYTEESISSWYKKLDIKVAYFIW